MRTVVTFNLGKWQGEIEIGECQIKAEQLEVSQQQRCAAGNG
jgi:hypothetical protein